MTDAPNDVPVIRSAGAAAERMRLHRGRRRNGYRSIKTLLHSTQVDELVERGLLLSELRNDNYALIAALEGHLERSLSPEGNAEEVPSGLRIEARVTGNNDFNPSDV